MKQSGSKSEISFIRSYSASFLALLDCEWVDKLTEDLLQRKQRTLFVHQGVKQMDESDLVKSARKLDQGALTTIFDTYAPMVYRYCFRLCLDPVASDEFVGVVFSRLLENLAAHNDPVISFRVYIFQIVYEVIVDPLEHGQQAFTTETERKKTLQLAFVRDPREDGGHSITEIMTVLNMKLNAIQRHVVLLRFLENFSLNETALIIGKRVSNVKVIQNRAFAKIGQSLGLQNKLGQQDIASTVES